jgi:hypothetical protein
MNGRPPEQRAPLSLAGGQMDGAEHAAGAARVQGPVEAEAVRGGFAGTAGAPVRERPSGFAAIFGRAVGGTDGVDVRQDGAGGVRRDVRVEAACPGGMAVGGLEERAVGGEGERSDDLAVDGADASPRRADPAPPRPARPDADRGRGAGRRAGLQACSGGVSAVVRGDEPGWRERRRS